MKKISLINNVFSKVKTEHRQIYSYFHFHNEHELYYLVKGNVRYYIEQKQYDLKSGDVIFIPKGCLHSTQSHSVAEVERILVCIGDGVNNNETQQIIEQLTKNPCVHIPENKQIVIEDVFKKIEREYKSINAYKDEMINVCIRELLILIARLREEEFTRSKGMQKKIKAIGEYILQNHQEDISLSLLSEQFGFSQSHLSKKFKQFFGMGINEYINSARIEHSKKLLKITDLSITDVAYECGFNDSNNYSTVFKKITNTTPLKYRGAYSQSSD